MLKKNSHIKSIIRQNTALSELVGQTKLLVKIDKLVQRHLDIPFKMHCKVANYRENTLYLHVDSPAWATRLRFATPSLVPKLQQSKELAGLKDIQIYQAKIIPPHKPKKKAIKKRLSKDTADQLNCLADCVTDEKLAKALKRLARHAE